MKPSLMVAAEAFLLWIAVVVSTAVLIAAFIGAVLLLLGQIR